MNNWPQSGSWCRLRLERSNIYHKTSPVLSSDRRSHRVDHRPDKYSHTDTVYHHQCNHMCHWNIQPGVQMWGWRWTPWRISSFWCSPTTQKAQMSDNFLILSKRFGLLVTYERRSKWSIDAIKGDIIKKLGHKALSLVINKKVILLVMKIKNLSCVKLSSVLWTSHIICHQVISLVIMNSDWSF